MKPLLGLFLFLQMTVSIQRSTKVSAEFKGAIHFYDYECLLFPLKYFLFTTLYKKIVWHRCEALTDCISAVDFVTGCSGTKLFPPLIRLRYSLMQKSECCMTHSWMNTKHFKCHYSFSSVSETTAIMRNEIFTSGGHSVVQASFRWFMRTTTGCSNTLLRGASAPQTAILFVDPLTFNKTKCNF